MREENENKEKVDKQEDQKPDESPTSDSISFKKSNIAYVIVAIAVGIMVIGAFLIGKGDSTQQTTNQLSQKVSDKSADDKKSQSQSKTDSNPTPTAQVTKGTFSLSASFSDLREALEEKDKNKLRMFLSDEVEFTIYASGYLEVKNKEAALTKLMTILNENDASWNFDPSQETNKYALSSTRKDPRTSMAGHSDTADSIMLTAGSDGIDKIQTAGTEQLYGAE